MASEPVVIVSVRRPARLEGVVRLPGDKSISHRALILNAVATGVASVSGLSSGADVDSTAGCLRALGVAFDAGRLHGVGLRGLRPPREPLQCGNSGTTMRLLAGLLAGQPFQTTLIGDESLSARPMERVVEPLRLMGAGAELNPLRVGGGGRGLIGIDYEPLVPSAQVKSAVLLAGLYAQGRTWVREPAPTRDHTELMLSAMGAEVERDQLAAGISPPRDLRPLDVQVPGDFSAAAFWLVAGALHPKASISIPETGVNPRRAALLGTLLRAGLRIDVTNPRLVGLEQVADLRSGRQPEWLRAIVVEAAEAAALIDELPVLAVAATQLPGTSRITGAAELRLKESDRIAAMADGLNAMGARVTELTDGWEIHGRSLLEGVRVDSCGDHRVAMALAVAGLLADGTTEIEGAECAAISDPGFWDQLAALC
jgi:3-phosphoshikimate 1-carboxyvinyltransferase